MYPELRITLIIRTHQLGMVPATLEFFCVSCGQTTVVHLWAGCVETSKGGNPIL